MNKAILERYSLTPDGCYIIEIAAGNISDLYNRFDRHAPYVRKELDEDLAEYLSESASELGKEPFIISFNLVEPPDEEMRLRITDSISNYFRYLKSIEINQLALAMRTSFIYLVVGLIILFVSVWVNEQLTEEASVISRVFAEGLTVAAWVSLWEALATFLINWTPYSRQIKVYDRLANALVQFVS